MENRTNDFPSVLNLCFYNRNLATLQSFFLLINGGSNNGATVVVVEQWGSVVVVVVVADVEQRYCVVVVVVEQWGIENRKSQWRKVGKRSRMRNNVTKPLNATSSTTN